MSVWVPWQAPAVDAAATGHGPVLVCSRDGVPPGPPDEVEFWALPHPAEPSMLRLLGEMPRLAVVQALSSGVDHLLPWLPSGAVLCNAPQLRATSTAEAAMCLILSALNRMTEWYDVQRQGRWKWLEPRPGLSGRTALVVGHGHVGRALGPMLEGFGVRVRSVARRPRADVSGVADLPLLLAEADVVVLAAPLTPETRGLIDAGQLRRMRPGALLVNVARGELVDTAALLEALEDGRVCAALDVVDPEPLPDGHPLWRAPNVLISPHVGGNPTGLREAAAAFVSRQVGRFVRGEPLEHRVPLHGG